MKYLLLLSTTLLLAASAQTQPNVRPRTSLPYYDGNEQSPLEKAVSEDDANKVLDLLRDNPELRSSMGLRHDGLRFGFLPSPLLAAINQNKPKVARVLLETGSSPNIDFPLGVALRKRDESWRPLAELLLKYGALINGSVGKGATDLPIGRLLDVPFETRQKWDFLMAHGANVLIDNVTPTKIYGHPLIELAFEKNNPDSLGTMLNFVPVETRIETFPNYRSLRSTTLHMAIQFRNKAAVQQLIERGADLEASDSEGHTPLDLAVEKNDELLSVLLKAGAHPTQHSVTRALVLLAAKKAWADKNSLSQASAKMGTARWLAPLISRLHDAPPIRGTYSPLVRAIQTHDHDILQLVLDAQPPINNQERFFLAASQGDIETMRKLVRWDPDLVSAALPRGETPLHFAAFWSQEQAVRFLCSHGANANASTAEGESPMHCALTGANSSRMGQVRRTVAALFFARANPNDLGQGQGKYSYLTNPTFGIAIRNGDERLIRQFLDAGANPKGVYPYYDIPLEIAVTKGNLHIVQLLLERGANPNSISSVDMSPLMDASFGGAPGVDISRLLLRFGADINKRNHQGKTALSFVVGNMNFHGEDNGLAKTKFLIEHGADPEVMSENDVPLLISLSESFVGAANSEAEKGIEQSKKSRSNLLTMARLLLETKRVSLHAIAPYASPLETAVAARTPELLTLLLEFGADPNEKNGGNKSPLDIARENGKTEMVELMEAVLKSRTAPN